MKGTDNVQGGLEERKKDKCIFPVYQIDLRSQQEHIGSEPSATLYDQFLSPDNKVGGKPPPSLWDRKWKTVL